VKPTATRSVLSPLESPGEAVVARSVQGSDTPVSYRMPVRTANSIRLG
jgi:hypothetical protein